MDKKPEAQTEELDLASMTDDEISTYDTSKFGASEETPPTKGEEAVPPKEETEGGEGEGDETGGADTPETPPAKEEAEGSTSDAEVIDPGTAAQALEVQSDDPDPDQGSDKSKAASEKPAEIPKTVDYKSEYAKVMAPFKAAKREIKLDNIDDARRLMQMGVDYSRKMEAMKPYQRVLKTLEKNDLLDIGRLNFLIDLDKKNPEAIRKFLSDSKIDPMDLSLEEGAIPYRPTDHSVGDQELALDSVLDDIRQTDTFDRTAQVITKEWDTASRKVLYESPVIIRTLNDHMQSGIFDQIATVVEKERVLGRLVGLSDLDAYKAVGDAIQAQNGFVVKPNSSEQPSPSDVTAQQSQNSGSQSAEADALQKRRLAASTPRGAPSAGKKKVNLAELSDEQIEKMDFNSL